VLPPSKTADPASDDRRPERTRDGVKQVESNVVPLFRAPVAAKDHPVDDDPGPTAA
jgi:hypothetical protein